jgi:hypothetical protein
MIKKKKKGKLRWFIPVTGGIHFIEDAIEGNKQEKETEKEEYKWWKKKRNK